MQLDLCIDNANVHTMDLSRPHAHRIGILHGRVVALDDECDQLPARQVVDLRGATVLPGFIDAHSHLAWAGAAATALDLSTATSIPQVLDLIGAAADRLPEGAWLDAVGYDQRPLGRHLTCRDVDAVTRGRRFYAIHTSGHAHLVNSAVLSELPSDIDMSRDPDIVVAQDGSPTGLFLEDATRHVKAIRTPYAVAELVDALTVAGRTCASQGITFVAEAGVGGGLVSRSPIEVLAYQQAVESGRFAPRAQLMISIDALDPVAAHPSDGFRHAFGAGLRTGFGGARLQIGALKGWLDGGMMARTAALTAPYVIDGPPEHGALASNLDELRRRAVDAHAAGWQLALHAIGDRAVDTALEIFEAAQRAHPRPEARHRIEHCGLVRPDQLSRLAAQNVVVVTQPAFLIDFGDDYAQIMGAQRSEWMYRGQSYLDAGVVVAGSSDRPVSDGAPLRAVEFLVRRRSSSGSLLGAAEAMSVEDAIATYTRGAAHACRVEHELGTVSVGKLADLVVLEEDPWQVPGEELSGIPVRATAVGGSLVHGDWEGEMA